MDIEIISRLLLNNIGSIFIALTLLVSIRFIAKGNFFFKDSEAISNQREINELKNKVNELTIAINGDAELVGVIGTIDKVKSELRKINTINLSDDVKDKVDSIISEMSKELLHEKISNADFIQSDVSAEFESMVRNEILKATNNKDMIGRISSDIDEDINLRVKKDYEYLLDDEYKNSIKLKAILVNLFVFVNIAMLLLVIAFTYIVIGGSQQNPNFSFPTQLALTMSGLYISFAAFVIYVIKFANSRTLTILALREDWSKQNLLTNLINTIKLKETLNENDVALIKSIMTNRAQREQKTKHPYEIFLQGVSGSNIQFKGGRLQVGRNNDNQ
ncbi:hypothetical protein D3C73_440890 [compost metagenome]